MTITEQPATFVYYKVTAIDREKHRHRAFKRALKATATTGTSQQAHAVEWLATMMDHRVYEASLVAYRAYRRGKDPVAAKRPGRDRRQLFTDSGWDGPQLEAALNKLRPSLVISVDIDWRGQLRAVIVQLRIEPIQN